MTNVMQNPKFSTVLGLLIEASQRMSPVAIKDKVEHEHVDLIGKLGDSIKSVFKEIF